MKVLLLAIGLLFFTAAPVFSQAWGLGLRFGDPSGLTIKHYLARHAWEINVGRTGFGYHDAWYDKRFYTWYKDRGFQYEDISYEGYRARVPIALQFHYLIQRPLSKIDKNNPGRLDWYYGFGGQARFITYYYNYRYKVKGGNWVYVSDDRVFNTDFGADALIGLEYFFKAPISLFLDATLFMEVVDDPFLFRTQSGLGLRFRF